MAPARLNALASVVIAVWLAATVPVSQGSGIVALVGWMGVVVLALGLGFGYRGGVSSAAVAFVIRTAVAVPLGVEVHPPIWAQVLLIVLMVELAGASFTFRSRPGDPVLILVRGVTTALGAAALAQVLQLLMEGAEASGTLVRVAGIAAAVIAAGWVTRIWRRSGLGSG